MKAKTFVPNPYGDQDKGWTLVAVCWALVLLAFISTLLRVYVRSRLTRNLGWDDGVMVLAMTTTVLGGCLITAEAVNGLGRHEFYLTTSQRRNVQALGWADWIQFFITSGLTKISICLFLLRIVDARNIVKGMWAIMFFTALFTSVCVFLFLGVCRPLKAYWDVGVEGHCMSNPQVEAVVIAQGVLSIVTDLICAALPALFLRKVQINRKTKIGLCLLMGLGVITAICSIVRTALSGGLLDTDLTWATSANVAWRLPEVNIGIVCANAPILRPLYLYFHGRLQSQRAASTCVGTSKERIWPSNARRRDHVTLEPTSRWSHEFGDKTVDMEMGLPTQQDGEYRPLSPPVENLLKEKPHFTLGNG